MPTASFEDLNQYVNYCLQSERIRENGAPEENPSMEVELTSRWCLKISTNREFTARMHIYLRTFYEPSQKSRIQTESCGGSSEGRSSKSLGNHSP
jgi:hypothetical protein